MHTVIDFEITNYCQAKCACCPRTDTSDPQNPTTHSWIKLAHTPLNTIQRRLDTLLSHYTNRQEICIKLCGEWGDPLMHPELLDVVEWIGSRASVNINTNGGLRNTPWWDALLVHQPHVVFGIDGSVPEISALYRVGVDGERAINNMRHWFAKGGRGQWQYLAFAHNRHDWIAAIDDAWQRKIPMRFRRGSQTDEMQSWTDDDSRAYAQAAEYFRKHHWEDSDYE